MSIMKWLKSGATKEMTTGLMAPSEQSSPMTELPAHAVQPVLLLSEESVTSTEILVPVHTCTVEEQSVADLNIQEDNGRFMNHYVFTFKFNIIIT